MLLNRCTCGVGWRGGGTLQLVIMKWQPSVWGPGHEIEEHRHTSVLQEVRPTRTGLRRLSSTIAVYRVHRAAAVKTPSGGVGRGDGRVAVQQATGRRVDAEKEKL